MESIQVNIATGTPAQPSPVSKGTGAMVGAGRGDYINQVRGPFRSTSEVAVEFDHSGADLTKYGHTAIYRNSREFFANGGGELYVVETQLGSEQTDTPTPAPTDLEIDISGSLVAHPPQPGTVEVLFAATPKEEGVDYIIDYTVGVLYFKVAVGAPGSFTVKWKELVNTNVTATLALLEARPVTLTQIAYAFDSDLLTLLKTHCDGGASRKRYRVGFGAGVYEETSNLIAAAGAGAQSEYMTLWANRSGYFNAIAASPEDTWLDFIDPSACIMGMASSRDPWISMHEKAMKNLNQVTEWTTTDITNLSAAYVNYFTSNGLGGFNSKNGYLLDSTRVFAFVDQMRTWIYVGDTSKSNLYAAQLIGNVPVNRVSMLSVEANLINTLVSIFGEGGIANPDELNDSFPDYFPVMSEILAALKKDPAQRSPAETSAIQAAQSTRNVDVTVFYDYQGSIHQITIYLGAL